MSLNWSITRSELNKLNFFIPTAILYHAFLQLKSQRPTIGFWKFSIMDTDHWCEECSEWNLLAAAAMSDELASGIRWTATSSFPNELCTTSGNLIDSQLCLGHVDQQASAGAPNSAAMQQRSVQSTVVVSFTRITFRTNIGMRSAFRDIRRCLLQ